MFKFGCLVCGCISYHSSMRCSNLFMPLIYYISIVHHFSAQTDKSTFRVLTFFLVLSLSFFFSLSLFIGINSFTVAWFVECNHFRKTSEGKRQRKSVFVLLFFNKDFFPFLLNSMTIFFSFVGCWCETGAFVVVYVGVWKNVGSNEWHIRYAKNIFCIHIYSLIYALL